MRVGLTGGIASGKSTVSAILAELGAVVIDADLLAREVVARGTPGLAQVVEAFGPGVLTPEGDLDRPAVGAIVFADEAQRKVLEAIIHPLVRERSAALEAAAGPEDLVVHDIPLLAEAGMAAGLRRGRRGRRAGRAAGRADGRATAAGPARTPRPGSRPRPPARTGWPSRPTSWRTPARSRAARARVEEVYAALTA